MIGIIDYGMGNLRSLENALKYLGKECVISSDPEVLTSCERLILPGVGAFGDCMKNLKDRKLDVMVREYVEKGGKILGICLGMQMLFESSEEKGFTEGFGFLKGKVIRLQTDLPVPEIGWNELEWNQEHPLKGILSEHAHAYYVHSYYAAQTDPDDLIICSLYGDIRVAGLVARANVAGCQFHPEKSGEDGLKILKYYMEVF
jgi:glutamine amidotransferase